MTESDTDTADRVSVSKRILGHAHTITWANSDMDGADTAAAKLPVQEGTHYEVLASTLWGDYHVPTVIKWNHGEVDDLADYQQSYCWRARAKRKVRENDL